MDVTKRRKYTIGGLILGAFTLLLFLNERTVVRAADQWCNEATVNGQTVCQNSSSNPCSQYEGWSCRMTKGDGCKCTSNQEMD